MEPKKPGTLNMTMLFDIVINDDLKRFEFKSKTNKSTSYTVGYNEVDNLDDAKIAVYMAILKDAPHLIEYNN
jgi:hypothetical protein